MIGNHHVRSAAGTGALKRGWHFPLVDLGLHLLEKVMAFVKNNTVMTIACCAAVVTSIYVPLDRQYLEYFDVKTLACLFCVLAVVCALKNIQFFLYSGRKNRPLFRKRPDECSGTGLYHLYRFHADCQ